MFVVIPHIYVLILLSTIHKVNMPITPKLQIFSNFIDIFSIYIYHKYQKLW